MYYLFTKNILIQITEDLKNKKFLIGDLEFDTLPQNIINDSFSSSNWNRAFKFKPNKDVLEYNTFFIMVEIDLFFKNNKIEVLTKKSFFQNIINQPYFKNCFLNEVVKHYFKNTLRSSINLDNESLFLAKYKPENKKDILRIDSFDRFVIFDENIDLSKKKFQTLFIYKKGLKKATWSVNSKNQLIYKIPNNLSNELINQAFAFDLNSQYFLINNNSKNNPNLIFELLINDNLVQKTLSQSIIQALHSIEDEHTSWHLYNFTKELKYIENDINNLSSNHEIISLKSKIFKQNYLNLLSKPNK
ncbi:hypothetical protein [Mesoplasma corruscae]|uniref:Uncharacterized protein n=1 Tax=Mesoplasma corruscae TaxID=216874 RepID=A0A2S5RHF5_9MOLU|nr:hypothetical protein [Mesoplasma corruscae]PPE06731.1 hypothetical protein MCORR_v1c03620 [Mesoplasma corruscae]